MARRWVLLVIDDATALSAVEEIVRELGFHPTIASDAASGAEQAKDLKAVVVLSDKPAPAGGYGGRPFQLLDNPLDPGVLKTQILFYAKREEAKAAAPAAPAAAPAEPAAPAKRWVVAASVDPAAPTLLDMALLGLGLETAAVQDAAQVDAQVESLKPELFLCDMDLPGVPHGVDVLKTLRRNPATSLIPLLLIGSEEPDEALAKILAGDTTVRFYKKPLEAERLRAFIMNLLTGEPLPQPAAAPDAAAAASARGTALILDADPASRALYESVLKEIGVKAVPGDPSTAQASATENKPLLIVSDLAAPGAVDLMTAMRMDALLSGIPFLFTADMPAPQAMGMLSWDDDTVRFVKKPLDAAKFKTAAAELTRWQPG